MRKIQKISDLQPTIGFTEFDIYTQYRHSFESSELGPIRPEHIAPVVKLQSIPVSSPKERKQKMNQREE